MNTMTVTVSLSDQCGDKYEKLTQRIEYGLKKKKRNELWAGTQNLCAAIPVLQLI